jgi:cytolysin-activating lysine-acyltransferase
VDNLAVDMTKKPVARPSEARRERMAQSFADIVGVLMRDQGFRNLRLGDLEWLVLPPIMAGQFRLGHSTAQLPGGKLATTAKGGGILVPVAVALWASVSPAIDKRLSENLDQPLTLRPNEWASGDHLWLITLAGDKRGLPAFVKRLAKDEFKGRQVKMRASGPDGKIAIKSLNPPN